jgi:hypothetical protein
MLDLQHQYNNCTTIPHMRVGPTYWSPPSCEGLLYSCCIGVVQESNLFTFSFVPSKTHNTRILFGSHLGVMAILEGGSDSCTPSVQQMYNYHYSLEGGGGAV